MGLFVGLFLFLFIGFGMQVTSQLRSLKNAFSLLRDRSVLRIEGKDAFKFLQGLTTNDLALLHRRPITSIYTNILNVQGRVAYDILISPSPESPITSDPGSTPQHFDYLIDCDSNVVSDIQQHLLKYKLRNKFTITDLTNKYQVWSLFGKNVTYSPLAKLDGPNSHLTIQQDESQPIYGVSGELESWWRGKKDGLLVVDPRYEKLGARMILPHSETPTLPSEFVEVPNSIYNYYRMQFGVPQGPEELQKDSALPLEGNTELLNGVHFHKGCYIGQELVARTHYSGLIRKRIFPFVTLTNSNPITPESLITQGDSLFPPIVLDNAAAEPFAKGATLSVTPSSSTSSSSSSDPSSPSVSATRDRKAGKVISNVFNVGLAMMRLENLNLGDLSATNVQDENGRHAVILPPCWWHKEVDKIKRLQKSL